MRVPRVLMVFGFARSGSTIIGLHLQSRLDAFFCGEVNNLWKRFVAERRCSCGTPLPRCPVWSVVAEQALGSHDSPFRTPQSAARVQSQDVDRLPPAERQLYAAHLASVYSALQRATRTSLIIDSSKGVQDAGLVAETGEESARFLHLVRDPRGTAYSRSLTRRSRAGTGRRRSPIEAWDDYWLLRDAVEWSATDRSAQRLLLGLDRDRHRTVRYEDFASDPDGVLGGLAEWLGGPAAPGAPTAHVLGGNQGVLRSAERSSVITRDERWRHELRPYKRRLLEVCTSRARSRHGYGR